MHMRLKYSVMSFLLNGLCLTASLMIFCWRTKLDCLFKTLTSLSQSLPEVQISLTPALAMFFPRKSISCWLSMLIRSMQRFLNADKDSCISAPAGSCIRQLHRCTICCIMGGWLCISLSARIAPICQLQQCFNYNVHKGDSCTCLLGQFLQQLKTTWWSVLSGCC